MAALLLELGADPMSADDSGTVADPAGCHRWPDPVFFHHATADIVARCIDGGADVNAEAHYDRVRSGSGGPESYGFGSTPLHVAAGWTRDPAAIALLVDAGGEVNARNRDDFSPLHYAARDNGDPAVIGALVAAGAEVQAWATGSRPQHGTEWDVTPLHEAARIGSPVVAAALLDAGAEVNAVAAGGRTPLHVAAAHNPNPAMVAELVARGADVGAGLPGGRTALHEAAAHNGNPAVLAALLAAGAEVNAWGAGDEVWSDSWTRHHYRGIPGATPWGGATGVSYESGPRTPLHEAVMGRGDSAVVATLIEAGADVNARADLSRLYEPAATPLYWAVSANPDPAVLGLLVRGRRGPERTRWIGPYSASSGRAPQSDPVSDSPGDGRRRGRARPLRQHAVGLRGRQPVVAGLGSCEAAEAGKGERAGVVHRHSGSERNVYITFPRCLPCLPSYTHAPKAGEGKQTEVIHEPPIPAPRRPHAPPPPPRLRTRRRPTASPPPPSATAPTSASSKTPVPPRDRVSAGRSVRHPP